MSCMEQVLDDGPSTCTADLGDPSGVGIEIAVQALQKRAIDVGLRVGLVTLFRSRVGSQDSAGPVDGRACPQQKRRRAAVGAAGQVFELLQQGRDAGNLQIESRLSVRAARRGLLTVETCPPELVVPEVDDLSGHESPPVKNCFEKLSLLMKDRE